MGVALGVGASPRWPGVCGGFQPQKGDKGSSIPVAWLHTLQVPPSAVPSLLLSCGFHVIPVDPCPSRLCGLSSWCPGEKSPACVDFQPFGPGSPSCLASVQSSHFHSQH